MGKIDSFLEKTFAEHPELVNYKVLNVQKLKFGKIDLNDTFFDSLKNDYVGFDKWFVKKYDEEVGLSAYVDSLWTDGKISKFTRSLYWAFINKQDKHNSMNNIIHLRHFANEDYCVLALNNGFYSLRNPESTITSWRGNIYSADDYESQFRLDRPELIGNTGFKVVHVPDAWLPEGRRCDIVDCRNNYMRGNLKITIHRPDGDYTTTSTLIPIYTQDFLEIHNGSTLMANVFTQRKKSNIVVKNMQINGRTQGLYSMGDNLFWLKSYYELVSHDMDKTYLLLLTKRSPKASHQHCDTKVPLAL